MLSALKQFQASGKRAPLWQMETKEKNEAQCTNYLKLTASSHIGGDMQGGWVEKTGIGAKLGISPVLAGVQHNYWRLNGTLLYKSFHLPYLIIYGVRYCSMWVKVAEFGPQVSKPPLNVCFSYKEYILLLNKELTSPVKQEHGSVMFNTQVNLNIEAVLTLNHTV